MTGEALGDLRDRMRKAMRNLKSLADDTENGGEKRRLEHKADGVELALGYTDEAIVQDALRDEKGATTAFGLLVILLWAATIGAALAVVWTWPASGDTRPIRWICTAVVLVIAIIVTVAVAE